MKVSLTNNNNPFLILDRMEASIRHLWSTHYPHDHCTHGVDVQNALTGISIDRYNLLRALNEAKYDERK